MAHETPRGSGRWTAALEATILNFLGEAGEADLDGLLHVLQRNGIRLTTDDLNAALADLSKRQQVTVALDGEMKTPVVRLHKRFVGWT